MPITDALVIGEDWISEHYFTTDATKESFQGQVLARRKEWDEEEAATTRTRFIAGRSGLEARLSELVEENVDVDVTGDEGQRLTTANPLDGPDLDGARDLYDKITRILGFRTGQFTSQTDGPVEFVRPGNLESSKPLAIVAARPAATIEGLIDKHSPTLLTSWDPDEEDTIHSVSTALSTLMTSADGPDFALVLAGRWCLVAERSRWPEGRWLAVDLQLVCERNETKRGGEIDRALTCLDAASLAADPSGDTWWTATLEESVKHTVGVSKDLQDGVRESIELIANEVVRRRCEQDLTPLLDEAAQPLAVQSLRYLYRILFLLYAEASPELEVLPVGAEEYDRGYGLDRLRDLVLVELQTERARGGIHLYESLERLFRLVDGGHTPKGESDAPDGLTFNALRADLFRPEATSLIDQVRLGNATLLEVLRKLLLSKESGKRQRGFISYVELGINQLGAVYEGLMSYTGSFAHEDLYEVAPNGDRSKGSWVVPVAKSGHLDEKDFVRQTDPETGAEDAVIHRSGEFVFRLSGRDRQRSASYYTPEVLTRFTVEQALAELLDRDDRRTTAEEILRLTICEPALGSGAFAIEAVRQLGEQYLRRREQESGERIDPELRPAELQKVKAHIALHQVCGVDLNATAVELAEVSLWLDTMAPGLQAPWFGLRLRRGNSLVGARRELYAAHRVKDKSWLKNAPEQAPLSDLARSLESGASHGGSLATKVHHFLLPATGWGSALEVPKSVRDIAEPDAFKRLKDWRRTIRSKPSAAQLKRLQNLAERVEVLWGIALRRLTIAEAESGRSIDLWGHEPQPRRSAVTRDQIERSLADANGAYRRLRRVMDAWCALWYWPLTETATTPPTLDEWLVACERILGKVLATRRHGMETFVGAADWAELNEAEQLDLGFAGAESVEQVLDDHQWLRVCERVAAEQGFFHWELDFATVFARGGFDLQVGNPPWVRPSIQIADILSDFDPWFALSLESTSNMGRQAVALEHVAARHATLQAAGESASLASFLRDSTQYSSLTGRPDLYRGFMIQVWRNASPAGISGLIHMESHFTDIGLEGLRKESYRRLRRHWQFINELRLFDIQHQRRYGVHIYGRDGEPRFLNATSLYHPETALRSLRHDGNGPQPGVKDGDGKWDMRPHRSRIQVVDDATLSIWRDVLDSEEAASTPMLYTVNRATSNALSTLANHDRVGSVGLDFSLGWDETAAKKRKFIYMSWAARPLPECILQGTHIFVSTPLYKMPDSATVKVQDWPAIDLEALGDGLNLYTKFAIGPDVFGYRQNYTLWGRERTRATKFYRVAWRCQVPNDGERTLTPALIPPGPTHTGSINSAKIKSSDVRDLVVVQAVLSSILSDFAVRAAPKSNIRARTIERIAMPSLKCSIADELILRALQMNCLTREYADLWESCWREGMSSIAPILGRLGELDTRRKWTADSSAKVEIDRRNIQIEIDALVALLLDVSIDDLCTIYQTQFPVMASYDRRKYVYDHNGRRVPGEVLTSWRKKGDAITEHERTATHSGSGIDYVYELPFATRDREADFRTAYAEFEHRLAAKDR